jgi:hypothetical protein
MVNNGRFKNCDGLSNLWDRNGALPGHRRLRAAAPVHSYFEAPKPASGYRTGAVPAKTGDEGPAEPCALVRVRRLGD